MTFEDEIRRCASIFKSMKDKIPILVSHIDADGISSASIIVKLMLRENFNFHARFEKQLTKDVIDSLKLHEQNILIFTDLGSGQIDLIKNLLERTQILILDHHETIKTEHPNLFHLNPLLFGEENISSSVICYLFAKNVNIINVDLVDLAIVGAVGDEIEGEIQDGKIYRKVLSEAESLGKVIISRGLRLYGRNTRPIHKVLEYSFNPIIPGITGSESNAVQFLSELGIKLKDGNEWRKLGDLDLEEQKKLASAIIIERLRAKHSEAEDIFGEIYTIVDRDKELQDAREFATVLNSCGRTGYPEIGLGVCLNNQRAIGISWEILNNYRKIISETMNWIRERNSIVETNYATYVFCKDKIPDTMISTITSILLNSSLIKTNKPVFGFVDSGRNVKVSARVSRDSEINLKEVVSLASSVVGGNGGGHKNAAGAIIEKGKEEEFMKTIDNILGGSIDKKS